MWENFKQFVLSGNTGCKVGVILGFFVSLFIVVFGLTQTLFIVFCMLLGGFIGRRMDNNYTGFESFKQRFCKKEEEQ